MGTSAGKIIAIPAQPGHIETQRNPRVEIKSRTAEVYQRKVIGIREEVTPDQSCHECSIPYKLLRDNPAVYYPSLALSISYDAGSVLNLHPCLFKGDRDPLAHVNKDTSTPTMSPLGVRANDASGTIKQLYIYTDGKLLTAKVNNDPNLATYLEFVMINEHGREITKTYPLHLISSKVLKVEFPDWTFYVSDVKTLAAKADREIRIINQKIYTEQEHNDLVREATAELKEELAQTKLKLAESDEKLKLAESRVDSYRQDIKQMREMNQDSLKHTTSLQLQEINRRTNELKLQKEQVSANSTELTAISNVTKVLLVAVPTIVAGAVAYYSSTTKSVIGACVSGALTACKSLVKGAVNKVCQSVGSFIGSCFSAIFG
jgi:hypothetical protein